VIPNTYDCMCSCSFSPWTPRTKVIPNLFFYGNPNNSQKHNQY
jgi:hypothetical protein